MLENLHTNSQSLHPYCIAPAYYVAHFRSVWRKKNTFNNPWAAPLLVLYRIITECLFGYEAQTAATIGRRLTIHHGYVMVINKNMVTGDDSTIRYGVTIDSCGTNDMTCLHIGNGVEPGANVTIPGDIMFSNNITVDAGGVAFDFVPNNTLVMGEKARAKVIK